jgi:transcriptional regulator with PAS, ATPase and Fis domain
MPRVLLSWIGSSDLGAPERQGANNLGPIAQACQSRPFEHLVLLNDYPEGKTRAFEAWLRQRIAATLVVRNARLASPNNLGDIYRAATAAVEWAREEYGKDAKLTFHMSPGTPSMAVIWIILAKNHFDAELLQSSREEGVVTAEIPFDIAAEFIPTLARKADATLERLSGGFRPEAPEFDDILHRSDQMRRLIQRARQAAAYSAPVLIQGETGTGKELLASAIHKASPRRSKPFQVLNCGALPTTLFESELFGHERGAFTGATQAHAGMFEHAQGGTLFLDEVGELAPESQVKLLRALQEKKVRRIGGKQERPVDVRIIAATHRDLLQDVATGRFREDLFFRLAVLVLHSPPLREREGDVGLLIDRLLGRINADAPTNSGQVQKKLSAAARNLLLRHDWPGNVRELEGTLLRAFIWSRGATIDAADVREALLIRPTPEASSVLDRPLGEGFSLEDTLSTVARHYLTRALAEANNNKTRAAQLIGLRSYQTLTNWLKKYDVADG